MEQVWAEKHELKSIYDPSRGIYEVDSNSTVVQFGLFLRSYINFINDKISTIDDKKVTHGNIYFVIDEEKTKEALKELKDHAEKRRKSDEEAKKSNAQVMSEVLEKLVDKKEDTPKRGRKPSTEE